MPSGKVIKILSLSVVLALAACGESSNVRAVKAEIASRLREPGSARWSNIREHGILVCGEVSGRDASGAYGEAQKFYGVVDDGRVSAEVVPPDGSGDLCAAHEESARRRAANRQ